MEINRELVFSTCHLCKECYSFLIGDFGSENGLLVGQDEDYGWRFLANLDYLGHDNQEQIPVQIRKLCQEAIKNQCKWLVFDRDLEATGGFEVFSWD
jgi:hypothetical protein